MHDKLTGLDVQPSPGILVLGRYGTRDTGAWQPIVGSRHGWPGAEPLVEWAVPDQAFVDHVVRLHRELIDRQPANRSLRRWLDLSPLLVGDDVRETLKPHRIEKALDEWRGDLAAVCRSPHTRLRTEHQLMPVSMVRRISSRTITHLAQHSETWAARGRTGVHPNRLLGQITVADTELVENRIVAMLLDELLVHATERLLRLNRIRSMFEDVRRFLDDASARPWKTRLAAFERVGQVLRDVRLDHELDQARQQAEALRADISSLGRSPLRTGVAKPLNPGVRVPGTNLFVNDPHYRRCGSLWEVWASEQGHTATEDDRVRQLRDWCAGFDTFVALLVIQGLVRLGLLPVEGANGPRHGEAVVAFRLGDELVELDWDIDGSITLVRDRAPVLRVVPIPHCLMAARDIGELRTTLAGALSANPVGGVPVAVVYPGNSDERVVLPPDLQEATHGYRTPSNGGICAVVPVNPLEIDSVDRVSRALRWAVDGSLYRVYPPIVTASREESSAMAQRLDWVRPSKSALEVHRAPVDVTEGTIARATIAALDQVHGNRRNAATNTRAAELTNDLLAAGLQVLSLTTCPLCRQPSVRPGRTLSARDNSTYHCVCGNCGGTWETRLCVSCGDRYPVLSTPQAQDQTGGPEHVIEKELSHDVLASACWARPRVYICSTCRTCDSAGKVDCSRCGAVPNGRSRPSSGTGSTGTHWNVQDPPIDHAERQ
ncbi:DUF2357 domain-containing protein [Actinosynnema sp. NPDC023587]|uniref:DUF2357 domain-containing protein n=1 Tax=Actinosynnema sp. NPDC023587 TaxID=3154695 RepID=UPI0033DA8766